MTHWQDIENHMVLPHADDDLEDDDMGTQVNFGQMTAEQTKSTVTEAFTFMTDDDVLEVIQEWADNDSTRIDEMADLAESLGNLVA